MNHRHNHNNIITHLKVYECKGGKLPDLINHVFISRQTTKQLANYIEKEDWGTNNVLLYKYLDYTWRIQLINKMIKIFTYNNGFNLVKRIVFHTGLKIKNNNKDLYLLLIPNKKSNNEFNNLQAWRVAFGLNDKNESFVTKRDLINFYKIKRCDIPLKNKFNVDDINFDESYTFYMDSFQRIKTAQTRIMEALKKEINYNNDISFENLKSMIDASINIALNNVKNNSDIIGKQVFLERNVVSEYSNSNIKVTTGFHLELLLPIKLELNNKSLYFAIVLRPNHNKRTYEGMSIITREMAYINSRLIGDVKLKWIQKNDYEYEYDSSITSNTPSNSNISISPTTTTTNISSNIDSDSISLSSFNFDNIDLNILNKNPFFYIQTVLPIKLPKLSL